LPKTHNYSSVFTEYSVAEYSAGYYLAEYSANRMIGRSLVGLAFLAVDVDSRASLSVASFVTNCAAAGIIDFESLCRHQQSEYATICCCCCCCCLRGVNAFLGPLCFMDQLSEVSQSVSQCIAHLLMLRLPDKDDWTKRVGVGRGIHQCFAII
jgi:hypothetical protein